MEGSFPGYEAIVTIESLAAYRCPRLDRYSDLVDRFGICVSHRQPILVFSLSVRA